MGASRPAPQSLEQSLTWVTGSGGGYPQDIIYTVTQQSDVEPSIPLMRIAKGPAPRYSAPIPPRRGVHDIVDSTLSLHAMPEVAPKDAMTSKPRVRFQDSNNYDQDQVPCGSQWRVGTNEGLAPQ